mmetsp:Transcript_31174/g.71169  ORF Transcript_31174/g.71169 Transcript_31174/m.71169 type:complete len:205 (-) Transcript_31174:61-675(-)
MGCTQALASSTSSTSISDVSSSTSISGSHIDQAFASRRLVLAGSFDSMATDVPLPISIRLAPSRSSSRRKAAKGSAQLTAGSLPQGKVVGASAFQQPVLAVQPPDRDMTERHITSLDKFLDAIAHDPLGFVAFMKLRKAHRFADDDGSDPCQARESVSEPELFVRETSACWLQTEAHSFRGPPAEMEKHMQPEQTRKHHTVVTL